MNKCFFAFLVFVSSDAICQLPAQIKLPDHPRILLLKGEEKSIRAAIAGDPLWKKMHETIKKYCDVLIDSAVLGTREAEQPVVDYTEHIAQNIEKDLLFELRIQGDRGRQVRSTCEKGIACRVQV